MSSGVKSGFDVYWFSTSLPVSPAIEFHSLLMRDQVILMKKAAMMMMRGMTAKDFDPVRYAGRWFEVASLKTWVCWTRSGRLSLYTESSQHGGDVKWSGGDDSQWVTRFVSTCVSKKGRNQLCLERFG
ncbi:hypothetical protein KSS87_001191 [Heliosperma pusillum]|nr:hypothetical protein KSS87_001191 [Heliosperma pusillum]